VIDTPRAAHVLSRAAATLRLSLLYVPVLVLVEKHPKLCHHQPFSLPRGSMNIYLSSRSPWNATFATEDGQILYKVETPLVVGTRTATITRVVPNDSDSPPEATSTTPEGDHHHDSDADPDMKDRYAFMASIEFRHLSPSTIKLIGSEFSTKDYFRRERLVGLFGPYVLRWLLCCDRRCCSELRCEEITYSLRQMGGSTSGCRS
jgi:hypothetical protein